MAYGIALSEEVRLSLAEAANNVGTAINSGEGGVLPEELDTGRKIYFTVFQNRMVKGRRPY